NERPKQAEWCSDNTGQHIDNGLAYHRTKTELRVVDVAGNRHLQIDYTFAILQQRHGEIERKTHGVRVLHSFPEPHVANDDGIAGVQRAVLYRVHQLDINPT